MNWDRIEGQWKQRRGKAVHHWGKVMNDELAAIAGRHEQLVGTLQEKYGIAREAIKHQDNEIKAMMEQLKISHRTIKELNKLPRKGAAIHRKKAVARQRSRNTTNQR